MATEILPPPIQPEAESTHPTEEPLVAEEEQHDKPNNTTELVSVNLESIDFPIENEQKEKTATKMSEGVEVVLDGSNNTSVVDVRSSNQNVFRAPDPVRPRAVRAQGGYGPSPVKSSGSYGYGAPPPSHADYGHGPYPVSYAPSTSFDEGGYPAATAHFSPHVQYPHPGRHLGDVNVISPNHKEHAHRPPMTPRRHSHHGYHYPPASPVSRPVGQSHSPQRMRNYAMRRPEGPYSAAQRSRSGRHPEDGTWNSYPSPDRSRPPIVTESSFDSEHYSSHASHPTTPNAPHYGPPVHGHNDPNYGPNGQAGSFGSFDNSHAPPPHHDHRYYGHSPYHHPPESPYSSYSYHGYSPGGGYYDQYSPHPEYGHPPYSYEDDRYHDSPHGHSQSRKDASGMMLPAAAAEVDFEVTDPPMEPVTPPSKTPVCESPADINSYDVLCGRGGGTNSQVGNRRFRKLVQEFQPTYLLARRKEKPLLARTIVLIIRKRGGRFLKKDDETGELYEVGDSKAEAKTSQALREGLDVRATKSAASNLLDKKKKKKAEDAASVGIKEEEKSPVSVDQHQQQESPKPIERKSPESSALSLPRLNEEQPQQCPPSPNSMQYRKRRRMRSGDAGDRSASCGMGFQDKLFPDFCPPRADLGRVPSPAMHDMPTPMDMTHIHTPTRSNMKIDDDDIYAGQPPPPRSQGCAGIALDIVTGAAAGSFCLGPRFGR